MSLGALHGLYDDDSLFDANTRNAMIAAHVAQLGAARQRRLEAEALAHLRAGALLGDLVIVTSPLIPDGRVMTRAQEAAHAEDLASGVTAWAEYAAGMIGLTADHGEARERWDAVRRGILDLAWKPPAPAAREWPVVAVGLPRTVLVHDGWSAVFIKDGPDPKLEPYDPLGAIAPQRRREPPAKMFEVRRFVCCLPGRTDFTAIRVAVPSGTAWDAAAETRAWVYVCRLYLLGRWQLPDELPDQQPPWSPLLTPLPGAAR